jgi:hypothetical protein
MSIAKRFSSTTVYDVMGRQVALLAEGGYDAGRHELHFDARDLSSGVYLVRATVTTDQGDLHTFTATVTLAK